MICDINKLVKLYKILTYITDASCMCSYTISRKVLYSAFKGAHNAVGMDGASMFGRYDADPGELSLCNLSVTVWVIILHELTRISLVSSITRSIVDDDYAHAQCDYCNTTKLIDSIIVSHRMLKGFATTDTFLMNSVSSPSLLLRYWMIGSSGFLHIAHWLFKSRRFTRPSSKHTISRCLFLDSLHNRGVSLNSFVISPSLHHPSTQSVFILPRIHCSNNKNIQLMLFGRSVCVPLFMLFVLMC